MGRRCPDRRPVLGCGPETLEIAEGPGKLKLQLERTGSTVTDVVTDLLVLSSGPGFNAPGFAPGLIFSGHSSVLL